MFVFVDGQLAATVHRSVLLGLTSKKAAQLWVDAYRKVFPFSLVEMKPEWTNGVEEN
jgi:hypothetical protein